MGCGTSKITEWDEKAAWELFTVRARVAGYSKTELAAVPEANRPELARTLGFVHVDEESLLAHWKKLKVSGDASSSPTKQHPALSLPQRDPRPLQHARAEEIESRAVLYQYTFPTNLPPFVEELPKAEVEGASHIISLIRDAVGTRANLKLNNLIDDAKEFVIPDTDPFQDWKDLYLTRAVPVSAHHWQSDAYFGFQRLNGVHPTLIRRFERVPSKFPVTDELLHPVLPGGKTIEELIAAKRLYWCDYDNIDNLPFPPENNPTAPMVLLVVSDIGQLLPVAIQLFQRPGPANPIFTPNPEHTTRGAWLCAKIHAQVADAITHEVSSHFLGTHALMEICYISMMRHVSERHPLSELLRPHFWFTMALNWAARKYLIAPGGALPRLMVSGYEGLTALLSHEWLGWDFSRFDLPYRLKRRGVDDTAALPNFFYRDDALKIWHVLVEYVHGLVEEFYPSDADVMADFELRAWILELTSQEQVGLRGLPVDASTGTFCSKPQLQLFLVEVIYWATAGHSAVNNGQWDFFGFIPNVPGKFHMAPPQSTQVAISDAEIARALPGVVDSIDQITVVHGLASAPGHVLGDYPKGFFAGWPKAEPVVEKFKKALKQVSKDIERRNSALPAENRYPYLDPTQISNSVAT